MRFARTALAIHEPLYVNNASCDRANHTRQYGASGTQREIAPLENRIPSTISTSQERPLRGSTSAGGREGREGAPTRESSRSWLGETKIPAHGLAVSVESRSAV